ncbi:citrate synthase [Nocardia sp. CDC160]|uniref:citrate synthase n=1 Tax=Nocardia sp. CDC160 TaxID=3112166 RepID=UPI002DBDA7E6|nr:citrate synthase [Nocardia sp. CDC160]MEC3919946.1 citrate synthase [Nocardia sp. CDC160]
MADESDARYLTTAEVADRLDIKPATVYAYVSRGLLTKLPTSDRRGSLFREDEVSRLARGRRPGSAPRGTLDDITTEISLLDRDELYYRGHNVADLVAAHRVESVANLLWTGELSPPSTQFTAPPEILAATRAAVAALPEQTRLSDRLRVAVAVAGATDRLRFDLSPEGVLRTAGILVAVELDALTPELPASDTLAELPTSGTLAERLWPALTPHPPNIPLLDTTLTLLADHGLAVSTVAARVAASARVHPYGTVAAALGALDSQYHGGASTLAYRFLADALTDPVGAVSERLRLGGPLPGFGHLIYQHTDPRADLLLAALRTIPAATPALTAIDTLKSHLATPLVALPNIDLALAVLMHAFDMRPDAGETIFAVARTLGWIAHTLEEYTEPPMRFRPTRTPSPH